MKYRLVIFDFDGTLADSGQWFLSIMNDLADEFHFKRMSKDEQAQLRRLEAREVMRQLGAPAWRLPQIMKRVREWARRDAAQIKPFPGVERMFSELRAAGIQIGIVSSNAEENICNVLGPATCAHINYFRCGASLMGKQAKLRQLLRDAKVPASQAMYVGDELRDATAARQAGMAFGAVSWGYTPIEALRERQPEAAFGNVLEISRGLAG